MPKTITLRWNEYRRLLGATVKPDNYREQLDKNAEQLEAIAQLLEQERADNNRLQAKYDSTYAAYCELRDKANDTLLSGGHTSECATVCEQFRQRTAELQTRVEQQVLRIRNLQDELTAQQNGNVAYVIERDQLAERVRGLEEVRNHWQDRASSHANDYTTVCEQLRLRTVELEDLKTRAKAVEDAEVRVQVALQLAKDMYDLASEAGRSVRPNRPVAPFPDFERLVEMYKRQQLPGAQCR